MRKELGLIHIYTGEGSGKTSAAMGRALRARGAGLSVLVAQLFKKDCSEEKELVKLGVKYLQYSSQHPFFKKYSATELKSEIEKCTLFLKKAFEIAKKDSYDLFIIDEAGPAISYDLVDKKIFIDLIHSKPKNTELIMTGRGFPQEFIELADYVTNMTHEKHPFDKGIKARKGIDY
ncbi:cob(I)yrinic acid a,c-diamide adenosyltransferase [Candidatus Woesearchaeota archaeon]|nr:cob(I)yrinic acid a,c-diamide adenosyltransferase [Candidatus Woesearchaeota archaeon]